MTARSAERTQFLADVLTTAIEGGVNYWATITNYSVSLGHAENTTATLTETMEDAPSGAASYTPAIHTVTIDTIARGVNLIAKSTPNKLVNGLPDTNYSAEHGGIRYLSPGTRSAVIAASRINDAGELDASDADAIVQVALFGEVTYG